MIGTVKFFNFTKGFGFITAFNGEDLFFHKSQIEKHPTEVDHFGYAKLAFRVDEGVVVEYDEMQGPKGPMGVNVRFLVSQTAEKSEKMLSDQKASLKATEEELLQYLLINPAEVFNLSDAKFEDLVAELLINMGYEVQFSKSSILGKRDIFAVLHTPELGSFLTVVECQRNDPSQIVSLQIVERFMWGMEQKTKANKGVIITTSYFDKKAIELEQQYKYRLSLQDNEALSELMTKYGKIEEDQKVGFWIPENKNASTFVKEDYLRLIKGDKLEACLDELCKLEVLQQHDLRKDIIQYRARILSFIDHFYKGLISLEDYQIERNKIRMGMLLLLDEIFKGT